MAAKKILSFSWAELRQRCPPNQLKQFQELVAKNSEYKKRVDKYPEKLPTIDWEYYRMNVRQDYVKMVNEFEQQYKKLNDTFDQRDKLDTSKYYKEVEAECKEMCKKVEDYKKCSNEHIVELEKQIKFIETMLPFNEMTMEDYINCCPPYKHPLKSADGAPSFWPHTFDEQLDAQIHVDHHHDQNEKPAEKEKDASSSPGKTPKKKE